MTLLIRDILSAGGIVNEHDATELIAGFYDRWYIRLVHYTVRMTENYPMAEDLAQDAFLQLYQVLRAGKEIEHPKAWMLCVMGRTINRRVKERTRYEALEEFDAVGKRPPRPVDGGCLFDAKR